MYKITISLSFIFLFIFSSEAQNPSKVKGNKNITIEQTTLNAFHTIVVDEDFEIEIIQKDTPTVIIETDENLHEFIAFEVTDSILSFNKTAKITSKKRLKITVNYDENLSNIIVKDYAEINSLTFIDFENGSLITHGNAKTDLLIKANSFNFQGLEKSKVKLNLTSENASIELSNSCKLDGALFISQTQMTLNEQSIATLSGNSDFVDLKTNDRSNFKGKDFLIETANVIAKTSSDVTINASKEITIEASGTSNIYLYNNPKININRFSDTVKLQKKTQ